MSQARQYAVVAVAKEQIGKTDWSVWSTREGNNKMIGLIGQPKCNIFVAEMLGRGNFHVPLVAAHQGISYYLAAWGETAEKVRNGLRPSTCSEWYSGTVPATTCIGSGLAAFPKCWPGDIITDGEHIGIISGVRKVISASAVEGRVVENDWGWRQEQASKIKIYRYHP